MNNPLVSVIIPTKNSAKTIEECLRSVRNQTYKNIELIVIDNDSIDNTKEIAKEYADRVYNFGPERSAQRNFGVKNSNGGLVLIIDGDMRLSEKVVETCINKINSNSEIKGIIIPEESFGEGFWAQCKRLERNFYVGVDWMEGARFFDKKIYEKVGGYNENMVSGEDWDLSQRIEAIGEIDRINDFIFHDEGKISLLKTIQKKFYYAQKLNVYRAKKENINKFRKQSSIFLRYRLFFSQPKKLFKNPVLGLGMLFMKTCEFGFGSIGYLLTKK